MGGEGASRRGPPGSSSPPPHLKKIKKKKKEKRNIFVLWCARRSTTHLQIDEPSAQDGLSLGALAADPNKRGTCKRRGQEGVEKEVTFLVLPSSSTLSTRKRRNKKKEKKRVSFLDFQDSCKFELFARKRDINVKKMSKKENEGVSLDLFLQVGAPPTRYYFPSRGQKEIPPHQHSVLSRCLTVTLPSELDDSGVEVISVTEDETEKKNQELTRLSH